MTWHSPYIKSLRLLIDDMSDEPTFTDSRLQDTIALAAAQVKSELNFSAYTITICPPDISPDPTEDLVFMNLVLLKSACIIDRGSMRLAAAINGVEAKCGPAVIKIARRMDGFATLIDKGYCGAYDEAARQYIFGNLGFAQGILSPFVNRNFFPHHEIPDVRTHHHGDI